MPQLVNNPPILQPLTSPMNPAEIDNIDTFYEYVKGRVQAYNPSREFGGIIQARDWPMPEAKLETPYLAILKDKPVAFGEAVSQYQPLLLFTVKWVWMIQGDNIPLNAQAANRGNKYRINLQMVQEMRNGHYPGFCNMNQYSVQDDGSGNPQQVITAYDPSSQISWSLPEFNDEVDRLSGILFCSGQVGIHGIGVAITQ